MRPAVVPRPGVWSHLPTGSPTGHCPAGGSPAAQCGAAPPRTRAGLPPPPGRATLRHRPPLMADGSHPCGSALGFRHALHLTSFRLPDERARLRADEGGCSRARLHLAERRDDADVILSTPAPSGQRRRAFPGQPGRRQAREARAARRGGAVGGCWAQRESRLPGLPLRGHRLGPARSAASASCWRASARRGGRVQLRRRLQRQPAGGRSRPHQAWVQSRSAATASAPTASSPPSEGASAAGPWRRCWTRSRDLRPTGAGGVRCSART